MDDLQSRVDALVASSLPIVQESLKLNFELVCHVEKLDASNLEAVLSPLFRESDAVMDLTTCVDSESVARLADSLHCSYINACLEVFQESETLSEAQRHARFRAIRKDFKATMVMEIGMNPGLISLLVKRALRDSGFAAADVDTIHVTEFDTHELKQRDANVFWNTWSPYGLYEEGTKRAELAWYGDLPLGWEREQHLIRHKERAGCEVAWQSVTPVWTSKKKENPLLTHGNLLLFAGETDYELRKYHGFIVTHGEIETISTALGKNVKVAFVYRVCRDARAGLQKWGHSHAPQYKVRY